MTTFTFPEGRSGVAHLTFSGPVPVLRVAGTPEEIGQQVAELALRPAHRILDYPLDLVASLVRSRPLARLTLSALDRHGRRLAHRFPRRHRHELFALAGAAGDPRRVVRGNTLFDLKNVRPWRLFGCSSLAAGADRTGNGPLLARNLDFFPLGYLHEFGLVTVYRGAGVRPFLSVGFPGAVGVFSGLNSAGLALATHEVFSPAGRGFDPRGEPFAALCRRALEECATVNEAEVLFRAARRATSVSVIACDRREQAVFELSPERVARRGPERGTVVCANHFLAPGRHTLGDTNPFDTRGRVDRLRRAAAAPGALGVPEAWAALDATHQGELTIQSMVFEPQRLTARVSMGAGPATRLPPTELRLTDWL